MFFFATDEGDNSGSIRTIQYPFKGDISELFTHYGGITRLKVSFDDNYLFTAGQDGTIIIYENNYKKTKIQIDKEGMGMQFAEEFLIPRDQYEE